MAKKVFLDANVVIAAGRPPGGPLLARVRDLVTADMIRVLTTDLTVTEVAKKHARNDYEVIAEVGRPHFRRAVEEVLGTKLPDTTKAEIRARLTDSHNKSTTAMFDGLRPKMLAIDTVKPSSVFMAYAAGEGFFSAEGKKDQFPDAFIFECLKAEASEAEPVIIVSADGDYVKPAAKEPHICVVTSIPELFKKLGLEVDAPQIDAFLEEHMDELVGAADRELSDWGLIGDVEDAYIDETSVIGVEIGRLTAFKSAEEGGSILVVGCLTIRANIAYTHPNWAEAMWDSEDKRLIPFEDVSGYTEVSLDVDISITIEVDETGEPEAIGELRFRNSDFQYVQLEPHDPFG